MSVQRSVYSPSKPVPYGTTKAVVRSVVSSAGGPKQVAARLGRKLTAVYSYADPNSPHEMSFDAVRRLTTPANRAAAEDLANLAHCALMPMDVPAQSFEQLAARSAREVGEFVASVIEASAADGISPAELAVILHEIDDSVRALLAARAALVSGQ